MSSKPFPGFPAKMRFTPLPDLFFSHLSPQIHSITEMKVILHIFWLLYQKKGYPKFVTYQELLRDKILLQGMGADSPAAELPRALEEANRKGILLHLSLEREGKQEELYFLNTPSDKEAIAKISNGEIKVGIPLLPAELPSQGKEKPNIFTLYEQNIGLLTPLIAEQLKDAEVTYPASWIEEAFQQAVTLNKRNWGYISRILERWAQQGRDSGEHRRYPKKEVDPDKYIRGKYGHLVRR